MAELKFPPPVEDALVPDPLMVGRPDNVDLTQTLLNPVWEPTRHGWRMLFLLGLAGVGLLFTMMAVIIFVGVGTFGINIPVGWGFAITNFVWWIGIGHAGTLISAILLLLQQKWRTSINRIAEAMTLFAVMNAGLFPLLHLGRPWFFYWLLPYPSVMRIWPQFKSPLTWDVFAVSTYFTVSLLFWYLGLVPDLAAARDASVSRRQRIAYGIFALGWRGSGRQWHHYRIAYLLLAGLATPLVLSVHTIVSFDFAVSLLPGWHETIFPPYFVGGAIFSGFAMVMVLIVPIRKIYGLEQVITIRHLENMAKFILATSWIVAYGYITENFMAWYSGDRYSIYTYWYDQETGPWAWLYWPMIVLNWIAPQLLWFQRIRRNVRALLAISVGILIGMWLERFLIVMRGTSRDFLPSSWGFFVPTVVDWGLLAGTLGFFIMAFLLFVRLVPMVPVSEVKELRHEIAEAASARGKS
jgi:molybdopterin-containing oxidoreductase family membrane subunit